MQIKGISVDITPIPATGQPLSQTYVHVLTQLICPTPKEKVIICT